MVAGAIYQFRIAAVNTVLTTNRFIPDDVLNFSEGISHIIALIPGPITTLQQLSYNFENGKIKLIWSEPLLNGSPITIYTILRDVGSGVFYPLHQVSVTSFTDTGLVVGRSYNYQIYASNGAGDGPISSIVSAYATEPPGII